MASSPSSDNSVVFLQGTISGTLTDGDGDDWSIVDGHVTKNGVVDLATDDVVELGYVDKQIWRENAAGLWWVEAANGGWTSSDGEAGTSVNPISGTVPSIISVRTSQSGSVDIGQLIAQGDPELGLATLIKVPTGASTLVTSGLDIASYSVLIDFAYPGNAALVVNGDSDLAQSTFLSLDYDYDLTKQPALINNGTMRISGSDSGFFAGSLGGVGTITVSDGGGIALDAAAATQSISLQDGVIYLGERLPPPAHPALSFFAPITDFGPDSLMFVSDEVTGTLFTRTGEDAGVINLFDGGYRVASLSISGAQQLYARAASSHLVEISSKLIPGALVPQLSEVPQPTYDLTATDSTTGQPITSPLAPYSGPVLQLQEQLITASTDDLNVIAASPNWYIKTGNGMNAITVTSGVNVLDGGGGSSFMTGGSGYDTFFIDTDKIEDNPWTTIVNFHSGDSVTFWGVTADDFSISWLYGQGAPGFLGETVVATRGDGSSVGVTFAGWQPQSFHTALGNSFGVTPDLPGLPGSTYMQVKAP